MYKLSMVFFLVSLQAASQVMAAGGGVLSSAGLPAFHHPHVELPNKGMLEFPQVLCHVRNGIKGDVKERKRGRRD